jgi:hypothetical protein
MIHNTFVEEYTTNYNDNLEILESGVTTYESENMALGEMNHNTGAISNSTWCRVSDYISVLGGTSITVTVATEMGSSWTRTLACCGFDSDKKFVESYTDSGTSYKASTPYTFITSSNVAYIRFSCNGDIHTLERTGIKMNEDGSVYTPNIVPSSSDGSLIFNMYSNNTTQPTSVSPYMWDLTGLKLNDFYTFGMNNWVKYENNAYTINCMKADRYNTITDYNSALATRWATTFIPSSLYGTFTNIDIPDYSYYRIWQLNEDDTMTIAYSAPTTDYFLVQFYLNSDATIDTMQGKSFKLGDNLFYLNIVNVTTENLISKTDCIEKFNPT